MVNEGIAVVAGGVLTKLIEWLFNAKKQDNDSAISLIATLQKQVTDMDGRLTKMQLELDLYRDKYYKLQAEYNDLKSNYNSIKNELDIMKNEPKK